MQIQPLRQLVRAHWATQVAEEREQLRARRLCERVFWCASYVHAQKFRTVPLGKPLGRRLLRRAVVVHLDDAVRERHLVEHGARVTRPSTVSYSHSATSIGKGIAASSAVRCAGSHGLDGASGSRPVVILGGFYSHDEPHLRSRDSGCGVPCRCQERTLSATLGSCFAPPKSLV